MKKILILTASTGAGHNSAAKSLEEEYIENGNETLVFDIFKDTSEIIDTIVVNVIKLRKLLIIKSMMEAKKFYHAVLYKKYKIYCMTKYRFKNL